MESKATRRPAPDALNWTIDAAEALIGSLKGVLSARLVCRPGGEVEEIHVLTTREVTPKQTVRNVESALLARFHLSVDHRTISVAQTSDREAAGWVDPWDPVEEPTGDDRSPEGKKKKKKCKKQGKLVPVPGRPDGPKGDRRDPETDQDPPGIPEPGEPPTAALGRLRLMGHKVHRAGGHRLRTSVELAWQGVAYLGEEVGPDLPRLKLEALAKATLEAMTKVLASGGKGEAAEPDPDAPTLSLDGVKVVEAFERSFVLVAVHALHRQGITPLSGAAPVEEGVERAVVQATLQATDRWVRGRL